MTWTMMLYTMYSRCGNVLPWYQLQRVWLNRAEEATYSLSRLVSTWKRVLNLAVLSVGPGSGGLGEV
jgi:hypothetical protein